MIYFIITTSIYTNCKLRQTQYIYGITKLKLLIQNLGIENYKIIIVENNGVRITFLDYLGCDVYYTNNNHLQTRNNGYKELQDILDCIYKYNIQDNDFIVKMTGRYILKKDSEFMNIIKNIHNTNYKCVIKYGSYQSIITNNRNDCITGLIGMLCVYIKQIEKPLHMECIEWNWAKVTHLIDDKDIYILNKLGINICPGINNRYFEV